MPPAGSSDGPSKSSIATTAPDPTSPARRRARWSRRTACWRWSGPITSQNLDAIVPVLASHKTPLLYATNYEGGKCNRYMFSFNTVPNQELDSLLPYMTKTFGTDYFLLGADRDWPHRMFDAAEPLIAKLGGKVVAKQYTLGAEKDFTPLIDQRRRQQGEGAALRPEGRRHAVHPARLGARRFQDHDRGVPRPDRSRPQGVRRQGRQHLCRGAVRRGERGSEGQGIRGAGARQGRAGHGDLQLCRDALQRAHGREGRPGEGGQGRQGGADRRARRIEVQLARRAGDHGQGSPRDAEHVPGQDPGRQAGRGAALGEIAPGSGCKPEAFSR